jgi:CheY-like chemotaxis protein
VTSFNADIIPGDYIAIEISDSGTGIAPEIIDHIFEPFFTTKDYGAGTGLGLSMAFGFVKQSGGHLSVYSEPGLGTTFQLYLPRGVANDALPAGGPTVNALTGGDEIVLMVEDQVKLRRVAVSQLADLGYGVHEAENADAALAILTSGVQIDLLFSDVVMPGSMNGLELARQAIALRPGLRILLTSGFPGIRGSDQGLVDSPFPLLSKPYFRNQLARAVRDAIDRPGSATIDGIAPPHRHVESSLHDGTPALQAD